MPARPLTTVAAVIGNNVAPFELGVICEAFGLDRSEQGLPTYEFLVCAASPPPLTTSAGFTLDTPHRVADLARADLIAIPAWNRMETPGADLLQALRDAVARGARVMTVCTGAFALAEAGLLDGRRATTHWMHTAELARRYPAVDVDPNVLYVDEGPVLTSAGTAAGIDLCLHIMREEHGAAVANAVARRMVVPPHRDGGQAQYIESPVVERRSDDLTPMLTWLESNVGGPVSVEDLARRAHMSGRTFNRRFLAATGTTPHRWITHLRVALAQRLLEESALEVEAVAERSGFGSASTLRHHFTRHRGTSPQLYRRSFRRTDAG